MIMAVPTNVYNFVVTIIARKDNKHRYTLLYLVGRPDPREPGACDIFDNSYRNKTRILCRSRIQKFKLLSKKTSYSLSIKYTTVHCQGINRMKLVGDCSLNRAFPETRPLRKLASPLREPPLRAP